MTWSFKSVKQIRLHERSFNWTKPVVINHMTTDVATRQAAYTGMTYNTVHFVLMASFRSNTRYTPHSHAHAHETRRATPVTGWSVKQRHPWIKSSLLSNLYTLNMNDVFHVSVSKLLKIMRMKISDFQSKNMASLLHVASMKQQILSPPTLTR